MRSIQYQELLFFFCWNIQSNWVFYFLKEEADNNSYKKKYSPPPDNPSAPVWADDVRHGVPAGSRAAVGEVHRAGAHIGRKLLGFQIGRRGNVHDQMRVGAGVGYIAS